MLKPLASWTNREQCVFDTNQSTHSQHVLFRCAHVGGHRLHYAPRHRDIGQARREPQRRAGLLHFCRRHQHGRWLASNQQLPDGMHLATVHGWGQLYLPADASLQSILNVVCASSAVRCVARWRSPVGQSGPRSSWHHAYATPRLIDMIARRSRPINAQQLHRRPITC